MQEGNMIISLFKKSKSIFNGMFIPTTQFLKIQYGRRNEGLTVDFYFNTIGGTLMKMWWRITATVLFCLAFVTTLQVYAEETQEDETAKRIEKAKQLGLEDWIDEEGYLVDGFYAGKSDSEISNMSLDGLVRVMTEEEIQAYTDQLNAGISLLTVTYYKKTGQINPDTGRPVYTGIFEVDGILAFCIEREELTPAKGDATSEWIPVDNENMRKVLYYGYNGPADCGYTFVETAMALAEANGKGDNSLGVAILAEIVGKELPPDDFYVWKVQTNDGNTQDLAFYTYEKPNVKLYLTKYSEGFLEVLPGARFKHTDPEGSEDVMESDENGEILWENLKPGIHQIEEIEPPDGYIRSKDLIVVNVNEENQIEVVSETEAIVDIDGNLHVSVENKIGYELPNTGSSIAFLMNGLGILAMAVSFRKRKEELYEEN